MINDGKNLNNNNNNNDNKFLNTNPFRNKFWRNIHLFHTKTLSNNCIETVVKIINLYNLKKKFYSKLFFCHLSAHASPEINNAVERFLLTASLRNDNKKGGEIIR